NSAGLHTNAVYGFINIMTKFLETEKPQYFAVAFDVHAPTFRHEVYAAYKGTRSPMPEELRTQVPLIKEVLTAMDICVAEQAGLEADDILGTLAYRAEAAGMDVTLVSGDRDLLQIATDRILIRIPKTQRGQTTILNYHTQDVIDAYQVTPRQFIEVKALMGDTSDNVPGIPKVGEKTATELIVKYGSVEGVYQHLDEIKKPALKKSLEENRELADLSLFLVTIKTDCEVALDKERARIRNFYTPAAYELFSRLGFRNFLGRFESEVKTGGEQALSYDIVFEKKSLEELLEEMCKAEAAAVYPLIDADAYGLPAELVGFAAATKDRISFVQIREGLHNSVDAAAAADFFQKLRARAAQDEDKDDGFFLNSWNLKRAFPYLGIGKSEFSDGIKLAGIVDCHLAAYLLNPLPGSYQPEDLCRDYLDRTEITEKELLNKRSFREAHMADEEAVETYACRIARALLEAGPVLRRRLNELKMWQLYVDIERPVAYILYDMQRLGIRVDPAALRNYGEELTDRIEELERRIH
ncbi:MAG: DNA polymerase I, partial [Lachnospiraceae bacterium]|nr:DNA polymerase I [Lachnospiraceae bacterium]